MSCDLMNNSKMNNSKTALLQLHDDVVYSEVLYSKHTTKRINNNGL